MLDHPIIDAHVHTYRSRDIGRQAMMGSGRTDYGGTIDELLGLMERGGIRGAVQVNMTPVADMRDAALAKLPEALSPARRQEAEAELDRELIGRLQRRNQWTCQMARQHAPLVAFIGLDPAMSAEELLQEVDSRVAEGACGIKLHPAAQRFFPADPRLFPVYERAQALGLPVTFHSGQFILGPNQSDYAHPRHFAQLLSAFPSLTVVLAHLGWGAYDDAAELAAAFPNVFFDCCAVINGTEPQPTFSDDQAAALIRRFGAGRVMFGSDYPWFDPILDAARIARLPLTAAEKRAVLFENAVRILRLSPSPRGKEMGGESSPSPLPSPSKGEG